MKFRDRNSIGNLARVYSVFLLPVFALLTACQTSPTGRKQLILVPEDQMSAMGVQAFQEMKATQKVSQDQKAKAFVQCIADSITSAMPEKREWELVVFENEEPNAFALPGGKIGVHTGLLKVAQTPDQLAAVIGHEVAHVTAKHGAERVSQNFGAQLTLAVAQGIFAKQGTNDYRLLLASIGAQVGVLLPFSRKHESEADEIGLDLMAKAGFDPTQSVELWRNMSKAAGGRPGGSMPEFLSTHPSSETRIRQLEGLMPKASETFKAVQDRPNCKL